MKRLLMLALLLATADAASQPARLITVTQCYDLAREHYPLVKRYGLIDMTEAYNVANASKGLLPQLAVNAKATYQSDVTTLPFDVARLAALMPDLSIPTVSRDQYQLTAELSQLLWDGGNIGAAKDLSRSQADVERKQLDAELYALNERVNQVYFGCLLHDEMLRQNALLKKGLEVNAGRLSAMLGNGLANTSDLEALEVELLNVGQRDIELNAGRRAYLAVLCALTGLGGEDSLTLDIPNVPGVRAATINRPELRALDAQAEMFDVQRRQVEAGLMPRLGLFVQGGYGRPGLNMLEDSFEPFYIAGVRLSWNVGRLYTSKNDRLRIEANRNSVGLQRETFLFNTSLQIIRHNAEIDKINSLLEADGDILRLRASLRRAAEAKLDNGVIAVADLIRELNSEDIARQNAATHRIQLLAAFFNLMHTTNE
ncbi:MAG: TolC family protein [Tannerellaceae bacterium]|jgi:outer membrane protein TolC|nr:TolC family protein [Tannerellaceae bacterium]